MFDGYREVANGIESCPAMWTAPPRAKLSYVRTLRPPTRRSQSFWGRYEVGGDGGDELETSAGLVVGHGDVEGVEQVGEFLCVVASENRRVLAVLAYLQGSTRPP